MKKFSLSLATVLAMSAFAVAGGDIEPVVEPVVVEVADAWAGPYVGLQAGYIWGDAETRAEDERYPDEPIVLSGFDVDGWTGGIFAGYNWRINNDFLLGIEGEWNYVSADDTITDSGNDHVWGAEVEQDWDASLRLIAGMDMGDYMPYITGGIAWAGVNVHGFRDPGTQMAISEDHDATLTGWTVGAGVEKKIDENLIARIQYRYSDYGDETWDLGEEGDYDTGKIEYNANMLTVGVSYRF